MKIYGRMISKGSISGDLLISKHPISFFGMIDKNKGIIIDKDHDLYNQSIKNKILLFPNGCGSTVGSYIIYQLKKNNVAPLGIINIKCDTIIAIGAIMSNIPVIDSLSENPYLLLHNGDYIKIDGDNSLIDITSKKISSN